MKEVYQQNMGISAVNMRHVFEEVCGREFVIVDAAQLYPYGKDHTANFHYNFDILLKPGSAAEISSVLKICHRYGIPVTPRGGGSGVTGGALPVKGGVVLSTERLNRIFEVNIVDGYVMAESGVVTVDLCHAVEQSGMHFPVFPGSQSFSFIGGNVAENAGSMRSCKYGCTGDFVLNLEVVLPDGEIIWTGANVKKNATGLNLTQLFVGSEGILGVITKVVYRIIPKPKEDVVVLVSFEKLEDACNAVIAIGQSGIYPSAVELICQNALKLTSSYLKEFLVSEQDKIEACLIVDLHEADKVILERRLDAVVQTLQKVSIQEVLITYDSEGKERIHKFRATIGDSMTAAGTAYRDIDACIPVSILFEYIKHVESICKKYKIPLTCFGHALDGNLHTMLMFDENRDTEKYEELQWAVNEIYQFVTSHGGVISGEHGIGLLQISYIHLQYSQAQMALMKKIKKAFDPGMFLNPGKCFPE